MNKCSLEKNQARIRKKKCSNPQKKAAAEHAEQQQQ